MIRKLSILQKYFPKLDVIVSNGSLTSTNGNLKQEFMLHEWYIFQMIQWIKFEITACYISPFPYLTK